MLGHFHVSLAASPVSQALADRLWERSAWPVGLPASGWNKNKWENSFVPFHCSGLIRFSKLIASTALGIEDLGVVL